MSTPVGKFTDAEYVIIGESPNGGSPVTVQEKTVSAIAQTVLTQSAKEPDPPQEVKAVEAKPRSSTPPTTSTTSTASSDEEDEIDLIVKTIYNNAASVYNYFISPKENDE
jgi:hypothetical protein